jgi:FkbM family methyltransferase
MARFSLYDLMPALPPIRVLDVGALDDTRYPPPYAALVAAGRAQLIGFEPDLAGCMTLNRKYGAPHKFLPLFAGAGGPARYHQTVIADTGSLYPPNLPVLGLFTDLARGFEVVGVKDVQTVRIDDITEIGDVDLFKIDIQGGELDVFRGAPNALAQSMMVHTEVLFVEMYEGQPMFADIDQHLRERGFWFHTFLGMGSFTMTPLKTGDPDRGLNQRLWSDAIYIRHPLSFATLSPVKLRKLAVLANDVYGSFDLAFHCLNAADQLDGEAWGVHYLARLTQPGADASARPPR